jgi:ABC-type transport system involved in multi-copper enzyme maturation permease subunit
MSTAEVTAAPPAGPAGPAGQVAGTGGALAAWLRLLRSELRMVFRRLRNLALLAALAALPVLLGIALRLATPRGGDGGGDPSASFISQLAGNGVFLAFIALTLMIALVLPLAVAVVSGDSVAGEANLGTLRYLLTVPAGRTRLLAAKYVAIVVYGLSACCVVVTAALVTGVALFPVGPVTLLSGNTIPLAQGLLRVLFVTLYVAGAMAALGAIGLAVSTFTEHPIGAIATVLVLAVVSEITDNIPQFAVVHPYLPSHWWLFFDSLLRTPIAGSDLLHGLLSFGVYAVIFCAIAWARFTSTDVTA